jgi:hypothetical protein
MRFEDTSQYKMGDIGQEIGKRELERLGYKVYLPATRGGHPFDALLATNDYRIAAADFKTKQRRKFYNDTGIDALCLRTYLRIKRDHNVPFFLVFVDTKLKQVYYGELDDLMVERPIDGIHIAGRPIDTYPWNHNGRGIVYFPVSAMTVVCELSDKQVAEIEKHTTRNPSYAT